MSYSTILLLFVAALAMSHAALAPTPQPIPTCALCPKAPDALPILTNIPGDNVCPVEADLNETEILEEFYHAMDGRRWYNNNNWLDGNSPCNWFGVTCDQNGRIATIDLHTNNLRGNQIPPSIGCLSFLKSLVLDNNFIYGQIPNNFCKLTNIQYLTMPNNTLGGVIPTCFSNLVNLLHLYLQYNGLIGSLPDFSRFLNIKELHVEYNCLSGYIPQVFPSTEVIDLSFADNYFTGCIPDVYRGQDVDYKGNFFCSESIPCWLSLADLGCDPNQIRNNVISTSTSTCPLTQCVSVL